MIRTRSITHCDGSQENVCASQTLDDLFEVAVNKNEHSASDFAVIVRGDSGEVIVTQEELESLGEEVPISVQVHKAEETEKVDHVGDFFQPIVRLRSDLVPAEPIQSLKDLHATDVLIPEGDALDWKVVAQLEAQIHTETTINRTASIRPTEMQPPQVIFVGAGPVGLWTAVQLKLRNPEVNILMIEKHTEYQRKHVLRLVRRSFIGIPNDARLVELCSKLPGAVRTSDLEARLLELANDIGVQFQFDTVESVDALLSRFPSCQVLIGSDGSHSVVRKEVFGDLSVQRTIERIADVKYEAVGPVRALSSSESYRVVKLSPFLAEEHVSSTPSPKDGNFAITLRLIGLNDEQMRSLSSATFKSPMKLHKQEDLEKMHPDVRKAICYWLRAKEVLAGEVRVPGSEVVTSVNLSVYRASSFGKVLPSGKNVFLVGDSAFGVPFFRALNNGLISGTALALALHGFFSKFQSGVTVVAEYNSVMNALATAEISKAGTKKVGLDIGEFAVRLNAAMPWQFIRFSSATQALIKNPPVFLPPKQ